MERRDKLLSWLHEAQERSGRNYLDPKDLAAAGKRFGLTGAELRGVASYYSMYSLKPRGRHLIRVCDSPVCRMLGSAGVLEALGGALGIDGEGTDAEGRFTLETCQCLGHCASAPVVAVDGTVHADSGPDGIRSVLASVREADESSSSLGGGGRGD
ncbi:MAG: NAD(P)H-dependent oxidoreductase subunit E [Spirochaetia bacterium]|nr:NAD(P)H-dependent oxidoreductase subunit E [Spirochaetia bacterium]